MGILAKGKEYLIEFEETFGKNKKIHVMSMNESQGVEFDIVIIVGIEQNTFVFYENNTELAEERKRIDKDLLYVALTRAISELHIMGKEKIKNIILD